MKNLKPMPKFKSEEQERKFWETHDTTEYFAVDQPIKVNLTNLKPSSKSITLRIPLTMYDDLKTLANKQDVPYQSMVKMMLSDKISEQFRKVA